MSGIKKLKSLARKLRRAPKALLELCLALIERNAELERRVEALTQELDAARREAKRQAAPFRKPDEKRKADPQKPERKKGHPPQTRPKPDQVDRTIEVPLERCPDCGAPIDGAQPVEQFIEDMARPMLKEWLDENMPAIVERLVQKEIQKIARRAELL